MSKMTSTLSTYELDKILRTKEFRRTLLNSVPEELCVGDNINLSRWTLLLDDKALDLISKKSTLKNEQFCIDASELLLRKMFNEDAEFWSGKKVKRGLLYFRIAGAKKISDYGISKIARGCPNLKDIDLSGCLSITDASLREIGLNCRMLQVLSISSCQTIEGAGLVTIAECCTKLNKLNISRCKNLQRYAITKIFYESKRLEEVNISHLQCISDEEIRVLAQNCPRLLSLIATGTSSISDSGILSISQHCPDLDLLDVSRREMTYRVTDVGMLALGQRCPSLRVLRINGCDYVTDVGLSWLAHGCKAMEELDFAGCTKLTDAGLRSIGEACHSLTSIDISRAKLVSDIGLTSISSGCPELKKINCSGLYFLADPRLGSSKKGEQSVIGIPAVSKYCKELESLDISGCFRLNIAIQKHLAKKLTSLTRLNLTGCNQMTVESLTAVGVGCTALEELLLADCGTCVCASSLQAFSRNCKEIKNLVLARCEGVKASAIRYIANFEKLEKLDVTGCRALGDESILPLCEPENVPNLKHLSLVDCRDITDTGLAWLSNGCKSLLLVALKNSSVTRHAGEALRECFPFSDLVFNQNFVGFWPKSQVEDRIMMAAYGRMTNGLILLQSKARAKIAKKCVKQMREKKRRGLAALVLQRFCRRVKGWVILRERRAYLRRQYNSAIMITSVFHMVCARVMVDRLRKWKQHKFRVKNATIIMLSWRKYISYKKMLIERARFLEYLETKDRAIASIQSMGRIFFARKRVRIMREHRDATLRLRERKALLLQRVFRGYLDRQHVRMLREQIAYEAATRDSAACSIQLAWRQYKARVHVSYMREYRKQTVAAAIKIQSAMRGRLARWDFQSELTEKRFEIREYAATRIQTQVRMRQSRFFAERLRKQAYERFLLEKAAATKIGRVVRMCLCKLKLRRLRAEHVEEIRQRVIAEINAAVTIQAAYRGMRGRITFKEKLRHRKGQWKELFDEDTKKRFFYNKLTGEIRWRMPQDLLDLIPRPICDNCCFYEGTTECKNCNEVFCGECWAQVHFGGRRKDHTFRAIYDYYDKRVDYGENEFPSKWPTEMMQDEVQGWMLRVAPVREPVEIVDEWEHYQDMEMVTDDAGTVSVQKDFYFNRATFESSYEPPVCFVSSQTYAASDASYGYTNTGDFSHDDTQYALTGNSSYDGSYGYANNTTYSNDGTGSYGMTSSGRGFNAGDQYQQLSSKRYSLGDSNRSGNRELSSRSGSIRNILNY